jgi:hypothetical protein
MNAQPPRLTTRVFAAMIAAAMAAILVVAWRLEPHPSGYGTATELTWPACSVVTNTGWPCPMCGMTTSVSATVHGQWGLAWRAQPFGLVFTAGVLAAVLLATVVAIRPMMGLRYLAAMRLNRWWVLVGAVMLLTGWGLNVLMGMARGTWPVR